MQRKVRGYDGDLIRIVLQESAMPRAADPVKPVPLPADHLDRMPAWWQAHARATFAAIAGKATRQGTALRAERIPVALATEDIKTAPTCPACGGAGMAGWYCK